MATKRQSHAETRLLDIETLAHLRQVGWFGCSANDRSPASSFRAAGRHPDNKIRPTAKKER
jgi:hypothetical protein